MGKGIQRRVFTGLAFASSLSIGIAACGNAGGGGLTIGEGGGANVGQGDAGSESSAAAPSGGKGGSSGATGKGGSGGSAQGGDDGEAGDSPGSAGVNAGGAAGDGAGASGGNPANDGGTGNEAGHDHGGHDDGGVGGADDGGGGEPDLGIGGEGGGSDAGGAPGVEPRCVFHTDAVVDTGEGGEGGEGGAAADGPTITVEVSQFIGPYLADAEGRTLYGYGADYVGDCETPPVSNCFNDCLLSWPIFDAPVRTLAPGLDEAAFGQIMRSDGLMQTTYYGWPLYYYKTDTAKGLINGQGKGKIWFAAETVLPNVNIMRASAANGGVKYLGDDRGRTLYTFAGDTPGSGPSAPVVGCTGSCLLSFRPFEQTQLLPVSYLEPADLSLFIGPGGRSQVAYRGQPLYTAVADTASGQLNGLAQTDGALAVP